MNNNLFLADLDTNEKIQWDGLTAAVVGVLNSRVHSGFGVYGFPANEIGDILRDHYQNFSWTINEKVAFEMALGVSATGRRAIVLVKQAGMNPLYDSLVNAAVHGIGGGIVILACDDVGCEKSTVEQDSRTIGYSARIPILDPNSAAEVCDLMPRAFELSESCSIPVMVRLSSRLKESKLQEEMPERYLEGVLTSYRVNRHVAHDLAKIGRMHHYNNVTFPKMQSFADAWPVKSNIYSSSRVGIITSGGFEELIENLDVSWLQLTVVWPLPKKQVLSFLSSHEVVVVLEETDHFLESRLFEIILECEINVKLMGRTNGCFAKNGDIKRQRIENVIHKLSIDLHVESEQKVPTLRGTKLPEQYPPLVKAYKTISGFVRECKWQVAVDVGSTMALNHDPYNAAEWSYCLGSPIGVAAGIASTNEKSLAVIGDYAFMHSGVQGLIEAMNQAIPLKLIVICDFISRRTGNQPHCLTPGQPGKKHLHLDQIIKSCNVNHLYELKVDENTPENCIIEQLQILYDNREATVLILTIL
ncbi:hypothetical protein J7E78_05325 [Paenibacillus polymyxa]|uniref:thiamine pyrophosphate-dependent enzyme n=1 Tax=Paenibacillus polymyxa TaxID=1406 RepID=UPI001BE57C4F|nr:thiamine pyrophosphate-dependent enzyme [Paenibacillus polymyxa]MBT2282959.1 hypothetical protein [Paenibacillus polymyxa]